MTSYAHGGRGIAGKPADADAYAAVVERRMDVMAAILKVCRYIKTSTRSIDADLFEEQSCQISSRSDLKLRSLTRFRRASPQEEEEEEEQQDV